VAAWVVILGPVLGIALFLGLRQRVGDLEERLVRDANATFSRPRFRPVHVDVATPGPFGDAVARHLPAIQRWADSVKEDSKGRDAAREIVEGKRSFAELPRSYATALEPLAPHLDGLLAGTHAERADLPPAQEGWRPCDGTDWTGHQAAALLAGLRIRRDLAAGDAHRAVATCLDGMALARDAAITGGLVGHMTAVTEVKRLWAPCHDALGRLDPRARTDAVRRLRTIRDALPSVAEMLRVEFLSVELLAQGNAMSPSVKEQLGPRAMLISAEGSDLQLGGRFVARDGWRSLRALQDAVLRAAEGASGDELVAEMDELGDEAKRRINPMAAIAVPNYGRYVHRAEGAVSQLDALIVAVAARDWMERKGRWPADVAELLAEGYVGGDEAARSRGVTLTAAAAGASRLELLLPSGDPKKPAETVALELSPGPRVAPRRSR
jgi:hypothetical protein